STRSTWWRTSSPPGPAPPWCCTRARTTGCAGCGCGRPERPCSSRGSRPGVRIRPPSPFRGTGRGRTASHTETEAAAVQAVSEDGGAMASEFKVAGRKSSKAVVAGAIGALSLVVAAGCSSPDTVTARCVDKDRLNDGSYRVVDEDRCDDSSSSHYGSGGGGYFFYYGGSATGSRVSGGSTSRPSDAKIVTEKGNVIQRGGMGGRGGSGGS